MLSAHGREGQVGPDYWLAESVLEDDRCSYIITNLP